MAVSNFHSSVDMGAVDFGGVINEDVMQQIWDISRIPLPFSDAVGSVDVGSTYSEWIEDELAAVNLNNNVAENGTITQNDTKNGARIGNHSQISVKQVGVTHRARAVDAIGYADELAYQVMMRQQELRRDVEGIALSNQAGAAAADEDTLGSTAGLGACITQGNRGTGTGGGFSSGSWTAYTPGTARALTEELVRTVSQSVWESGGMPSLLMSTPSVIRQLSNYLFTNEARIATPQRNEQGDGAATAIGSVNVFLTDFGVVLDMIPNRLQQTYADDQTPTPTQAAHVFILDPNYARLGYLQNYRTEPMAKNNMADTRLMSVDWMLMTLNREAHGIITDIDGTAAVTQS